jgi:MFS family permease
VKTASGSLQENLHQTAMLSWQKFWARRMWASPAPAIISTLREVLFCYNYFMAYRHHFGAIKTNKALRVLLLSNSLILISLGLLVPVYALFVEKVGGSALSAGFTAGALGLTSAIAALLSGKLVDKLSPQKTRFVMSSGWFAIGFAVLLYILVDNLMTLFVAQVILGFVKTIAAPAFDTLYARHLDKSSTGQEYGLWEASFFLTAGIGAVLGGIIVDLYGFDGLFIAMAMLAFIAAIYVLSLPKNLL